MIDTSHYKALLDSALEELTEELKTVGIHDPHNPQNWVAIPDTTDADNADIDLVADAVEDADERQALVAAFETRYNSIMRALKKIDEGTYGACEVCGAPIETERLEVSPEARTDKAHMGEEETLEL